MKFPITVMRFWKTRQATECGNWFDNCKQYLISFFFRGVWISVRRIKTAMIGVNILFKTSPFNDKPAGDGVWSAP